MRCQCGTYAVVKSFRTNTTLIEMYYKYRIPLREDKARVYERIHRRRAKNADSPAAVAFVSRFKNWKVFSRFAFRTAFSSEFKWHPNARIQAYDAGRADRSTGASCEYNINIPIEPRSSLRPLLHGVGSARSIAPGLLRSKNRRKYGFKYCARRSKSRGIVCACKIEHKTVYKKSLCRSRGRDYVLSTLRSRHPFTVVGRLFERTDVGHIYYRKWCTHDRRIHDLRPDK